MECLTGICGVDIADVYHKIESGYRMEPPRGCPAPVYKLMLECWEWRAVDRPNFQEINQRLESMYQNINGHKTDEELKRSIVTDLKNATKRPGTARKSTNKGRRSLPDLNGTSIMTIGRVSPRGKIIPPAPPRRTSSFRDRKLIINGTQGETTLLRTRLRNLPEENPSELSDTSGSDVQPLKPVKPPKPVRVKMRDADTQVATIEQRHVRDTIGKWGTLPKGSSRGNGFVEPIKRNKNPQPDVVPREEPLPETDSECSGDEGRNGEGLKSSPLMATSATQTSPEPPGRIVLKREKSDLDKPENPKPAQKPKPAVPAEKPPVTKLKQPKMGRIYSLGSPSEKPKLRPVSPPKYQRPSDLASSENVPLHSVQNGDKIPPKVMAKTPVLSLRKPLKLDEKEQSSPVVVLQESSTWQNGTNYQTQPEPPILEFFPPPPPEFDESFDERQGERTPVRSKLELWETRSGKPKPSVPMKPRSSLKLHPNDQTPVDEHDVVLPPSQQQLLSEIRSTLEFLNAYTGQEYGVVFDRCSLVANSCSSYLEMITPHSRFKLREHLTRLQTQLEKLLVTKLPSSSSSLNSTFQYRDLQSTLQEILQFIGK